MIKKHNYEAPDAELFVVKFEENFCETFNPNGTEQGNERDGESEGFTFD